jgi:hypothetical protein
MCSGADQTVMADERCAMEGTKYAAIGATVLSTAVLASLSGGYAVFMTFQSIPTSVCLGVLWGLIIFNLDRYIVSSLRRQRVSPTLPAKERWAVRRTEIARAVPRFVLAVLISVVITRPIELRLFAREIGAYVEDEKSKKLVEIEQQKRREFPVIEQLEAENQSLRTEVSNKEAHCDELHELAMSEASGKSEARTSGRQGKGPLFAERWENYETCRADLVELRRQIGPRIAANDTQLATAEASRQAGINAARAKVEAMDGLLLRLKGHSYLTGQNFSLALASLLIVLLFIMLETAPIIVKLLSSRGPYEDIQERKEHEVYVAERRRISNLNDEDNTRGLLRNRRNAGVLEAETRLRRSLNASLETLAGEALNRARDEIADSLVEFWRADVLKNLSASFEGTPHEQNGKRGAPTRPFNDHAVGNEGARPFANQPNPETFGETT